jgi:prepilin-type N-terminal cleavage/methylation domain-containing protein
MVKFFGKHKEGFTLIELVVVAGIISVIMLIVVFDSRKFNDSIALKSAAADVSIAMRQAQNFGVSVKESSPGQFNAPYGMWFDLLNPTNIFIYSDTNNNRAFNGSWDCAGNDECKEKIPLRSGIRINRLCATDFGNSLTCFNTGFRSITLTYVRPNPEPLVRSFDTNNAQLFGAWKGLYVELVSQRGTFIYVVTDAVSGQITVQNTIP